MSEQEKNELAIKIIIDLVAEMKRHDIQWGSKPYSHAVQFLRSVDALDTSVK